MGFGDDFRYGTVAVVIIAFDQARMADYFAVAQEVRAAGIAAETNDYAHRVLRLLTPLTLRSERRKRPKKPPCSGSSGCGS